MSHKSKRPKELEKMEEENKTIKTLIFSGRKEDFVMWQAKVLAYAHFKDFKEVLLGKRKLKKPEEGEN